MVKKEWIDKMILHYIWMTIVIFTLMMISPVLSFLTKTPFYHIQTYLGLFGIVLLGIDVLTQRKSFKSKYVFLLYGIALVALMAAIKTREFGLKDNLFSITWAILNFSLFYSISTRIAKEKWIKTMDFYLNVLFLIWGIACLVSIAQFFMNIGYTYVINPLSKDVSVARQGFLQNRLFGIFDPINHAAYISLMLFILSIFEFRKKTKFRWVYPISSVVFFMHIVLCGSRSAGISLVVCSFIAFFLFYRNRLENINFKKNVMALALSVCFMVVVNYSLKLSSTGLSYLSSTLNLGSETHLEKNPDILNREDDLKGNFSNNRLDIWKDYLNIHQEFGAIGLSPGNYMKYIAKHHPDLYIVEYIKTNFPKKFAAGSIYHTHNGYLKVFVSTGYVGILTLVAFLILCLKDSFIYMKKNLHLSDLYVFSFLIVVSGLISAIFDQGIFFMENTPSFLFWLFAGMVMNSCISEGSPLEKMVVSE